MNRNKPFQQHQQPLPPAGTQVAAKWYRRHIVLDHIHRDICIQIMWDGYGEMNLQEYHDIKQGLFWKYVPLELITEFREAIASGYMLRPVMFAGTQIGENHTVVQLVDITDGHHVTKELLHPVHDKM